VPKDEVDLMTHLNAMRFFKFDPFKYIDKKTATVGSLRKAAAHVDTTPMKSEPGAYKPIPKGKVMTAQDMVDLGKAMGNALMDSNTAA